MSDPMTFFSVSVKVSLNLPAKYKLASEISFFLVEWKKNACADCPERIASQQSNNFFVSQVQERSPNMNGRCLICLLGFQFARQFFTQNDFWMMFV